MIGLMTSDPWVKSRHFCNIELFRNKEKERQIERNIDREFDGQNIENEEIGRQDVCVCVCVCVTESRASIRGSRYRKELDVAPKPGDQAVEKRNEKKDKYGMVEQ